MRLVHLEVVNWCQHARLAVTFSPSLTGIVGCNGSGKSNLMGAVRFALTGVNSNAGNKTANICAAARKHEESRVMLEFTHGSARGRVIRYLRPVTPAKLELNDVCVATGEQAVTESLLAVLDADADWINETVLVGQHDLLGFLQMTKTERDVLFQRLFRTDKARKIETELGMRLNQIQLIQTASDIDSYCEQRTQLQASLTRLRAVQFGFGDVQALERTITELMAAHKQWDADSVRLQTIEQERDGLCLRETRRAAEQARIADLQQQREALWSRHMVAESRRDTAVRALAAHAQSQATARQLASLTALVAARDAAFISAQTLATDARSKCGGASVDALRAEMSRLQYEETSAEKRLTQLADGTLSACPVCNTPMADITPEVTRLRAAVVTAKRRRGEVNKLLGDCLAADGAEAAALVARTAYEDIRQQLTALEATLTQAPLDDAAVAAHQAAIQAFNDTTLQLQAVEQSLGIVMQSLAQTDLEIAKSQQYIQGLRDSLGCVPTTTLEAAMHAAAGVADRIATANAALAASRENAAEIRVQEAHLSRVAQVILESEIAENENRRRNRLRDYLADMRSVVHPSAAPRVVAQRNLQLLEQAINAQLALAGDGFMVRARDGFTFDALFPDGMVQPVERLSGGQKVSLALTFRFVLNTVAGSLGLLVLDEPTASLDADHIRQFTPVMQRLREYSTAQGLQCIIVTHETSLAPLFDQVISL